METKITIKFNISQNGSDAWREGGCMWEREILDRFSSRWYSKLDVCPKYVNGNFILLNEWMITKKEFNKNPKSQKLAFFDDLKRTCKKNKISYIEY